MARSRQPLPDPIEWLSPAQLANYIGFSERYIRTLIKQGSIPKPIKISGSVRWRKSAIDEWLTSLEAEGRAHA